MQPLLVCKASCLAHEASPVPCSSHLNLAQVEAIRERERAKMAGKASELKLGPTYNELAEGEA